MSAAGPEPASSGPEAVALAALSRLATALIVISSGGVVAYANHAAEELRLIAHNEGEERSARSAPLLGKHTTDVTASVRDIRHNASLTFVEFATLLLECPLERVPVLHTNGLYCLTARREDEEIQLPLETQVWEEAGENFVTILVDKSAFAGVNCCGPSPKIKPDHAVQLVTGSFEQILGSPPPIPVPSSYTETYLPQATSVSDADSTAHLAREFSRFAEAMYHSRAQKSAGFILSADEKFCFPNYMGGKVEPVEIDDIEMFFGQIPVYDQEFSRRLLVSEYPSIILNQTRKDFTKRYGLINDDGERVIVETEAEGLWKLSKTHDRSYLGGVTWNKLLGTYEEVKSREMRENLASFETICECMPHLVWTAKPNGELDFASKSWRVFTGLDNDLRNCWDKAIHPEDLPALAVAFQVCIENGVENTIDVRYRRHDGVYRWSMVICKPLHGPDGKVLKFYGTVTDVHDINTARIESDQWRTQMMATLDLADFHFVCVDSDWKVTLSEGGMKWPETSGRVASKHEILGNNMMEYMKGYQEGGMPDWERALVDIKAGRTVHAVCEAEFGGRWLRSSFGPYYGQQNGEKVVEGVLGCTTDQTEARTLVALERENARLLNEEQTARENDRLKSQFLAHMSHELRSPLNGILGMTALLFTNTTMDDEQCEFAEDIQVSAQNLLTIVNDLLDFAKIESGSFQVETIPLKPREVTDAIVRGFKHTAHQKNLEIHYLCDISYDLVVLGDSVRVMQILSNLFTNAIKFASQGSVSLTVMIIVHEGVRTLEFSVQDDGIGIDDATMEKLFKPFGQGDSSTARKFGGTGLGLVISRNLAQLMGGSLRLESKPGVGTKAIFLLPMKGETTVSARQAHPGKFTEPISPVSFVMSGAGVPPALRPLAIKTQSAANTSTTSSSREAVKGHVLVVEDNAINQKIAVKTVRHLGYWTACAWNGKEALDYLLNDATGPMIDIVLMDCQMPIMDGYTATRLLRREAKFRLRTLPVIALTASAIKGDRERCEEAGMSDYLAKPFNANTLDALLKKWMLPQKNAVVSPVE